MSVNIRHLHVGAHVIVDGRRERVRGLDDDNGLIVRFPAEYVSASDAESIAITPELLTELGFEYREHSDCWHRYEKSDDDNLNWGIIATEYALNGCDGYWKIMIRPKDHRLCSDVFCKYLHELESYTALNGIELIND